MNISTLTQNEFLRSRILDLQNQLVDTQAQVASGKKAQVYSGLGFDAPTSVNLNNTMATTDAYLKTIDTTTMRTGTITQVLDRITDIASEMRASALQAMTPGGLPTPTGSAAIKAQATARLKEVISLLNTQIDGVYLFGGRATNAAPMTNVGDVGQAGTPLDNAAQLNTPDPLDTTAASGDARYTAITAQLNATNSSYVGDTGPNATLTARVDDGLDINYGYTGANPAFQEVLRGLYALATTDLTSTTDGGWRRVAELASTDFTNGQRDVAGLSADLGVKEDGIKQIQTRHTDFQSTLQIQISQIEDVDSAEAMSKLSLQQNNLQVTYQVLASMKSLTLANFLPPG
jgi:flagellar hook-associated protein 3 FlgL